MLVYVDDIMVISHDPNPVTLKLKEIYEVMEDSIRPPKRYLRADIGKFHITGDDNGQHYWLM